MGIIDTIKGKIKEGQSKARRDNISNLIHKEEIDKRNKESKDIAKRKAMKFANYGGISNKVTKFVSNPSKVVGITSSRTKYGGRNYYVGGISMHIAKRRLRGTSGSGVKRQTTYGQTSGKVGRPKGTLSYRHLDPRTGKPMPATEWYRLQRALKRQAKAIAEVRDVQETQGLAKQGISPQQARMIVDTRQLRRAVVQQPQQYAQPQAVYQVSPQQAYIQSEMARIQQMEPWARQNAVNMLRRRMQVDQRVQNEGMTRQVVPETPIRQEISLMTGRPVLNQPQFQRRERWTY